MAARLPKRARAARQTTIGKRRTRAGLALWLWTVAQIATLPRAAGAIETPAVPEEHVHAALVADVASVAPGSSFRIAVRLVMDEGWHVNWLNPGDAGLAPGIAWQLPEGFRAGLVHWPHPERFVTGPLVIFGYARDVVLATDVRVPAGVPAGGELEFAADVSWLACEEACVPGSARVTLRLPVETSARPDAENAARIEAARRRCPVPSGAWNVEARVEDSTRLVLDLQVAAETTPPIGDVFFFPYDQGVIENSSAQLLSSSPGPFGRTAYQLRVEIAKMGGSRPARLSGVLVSKSGWTAGGGPGAIEIDIPVQAR